MFIFYILHQHDLRERVYILHFTSTWPKGEAGTYVLHFTSTWPKAEVYILYITFYSISTWPKGEAEVYFLQFTSTWIWPMRHQQNLRDRQRVYFFTFYINMTQGRDRDLYFTLYIQMNMTTEASTWPKGDQGFIFYIFHLN